MQGYISDLSKCSQQITSGSQTGATIASSQNRKCIRFDYNDKQYIWVTKDEGRNIWIAELDQNLMVTDSEATRLNETDTSKCGATAVAADTKCVLMGSTWIWIKKNGNDWCNAKNCTVTYKDSYVSTLSADSTGAKCGPLSTSENVQPAVGAPVEGKLLIPIFGSGRNFPTGNNSVSFKAVRYSLAEEDPVQIALSGQGSQSFFHYTPVGGANFEMTLLTQATPSQNTGLGNSVAYAQVAPAGDSGSSGQTGVGGGGASGQTGTGGTGAIGQTGVGSGGASGQTGVGQSGSGPINTGEVTQLQCEKDTISEDILSQIRRIREFRSYRISGTIPDNGTNSAISVINLPDGFYKVQVSKSGFSSCTAYFALEKGESPDIGGIPLVAKSSTLEPPSISSAQVSKIPGDDRTLGNIYVAQKSSTKYVYSSKCTRLGWVPEGQVGAMINTPLCQRNPQISQSGGNVFTDENGNPLTGPALQAVLANIYNRCSGANISIFGGSSGNDKMNPLEAMLIGAAGGAFEAQMNRGEIVTRDVVYPAGLALIAALTGSDVNIGVGNNCIGQSLPPYNMGIDCRTCYYCPPGAMCDPGPAPGQQYCPNQCYTQSWPNQIPWYMLDRAQSRMGR